MEGLSNELYPFNIACKLIEPGGMQTDLWGRSLDMTKGVVGSPYGQNAANYLAQMIVLASENRVQPEMVAQVIYQAATDGKRKWRYPVAAADFIKYRRSMSD
ncbi:short chain dehydrogenase [Limosilactobacillus fermentum]|nr:short chain dehydrogenase [Limosilactobacillus fermentum]